MIRLRGDDMIRETDEIEFKRDFVKDLNKEVVAFANSKGGEIYVGVNDDGAILGLSDIEETELQCVNHISNTIKPDITVFVRYERLVFEGKDVLKITVNKGSMAPYYIAAKGIRPEGVYIRLGTASVPASETVIRTLIKETSGDTFEDTRSLNQNLTFTEAEQEFLNAGLPFGEAQKRSLGLIGRDNCYTNLALLLSDQCEHNIKFALFSGREKEVFKDRHEFSGSLFRQLKAVVKTIDENNSLSSPEITGIKRKDVRDYPEAAIREAVLNAIIHRDYGLGGYTLVSMFDDRLEIVSLGGLVRGVEMADIMLGVSYLRNKRLAEIFYRLHFIEAYGTGITKIKRLYEGCAEQPVFESTSNAFKVTLYKMRLSHAYEAANVKKSEREDIVLKFIAENGEAERKDVENLLGVAPATATRLLAEMVASGKIERVGIARNLKYISKR